jgi:hypothetical protein
MVRETTRSSGIAVEFSRYDLILAIIPLGFLLAGGLGSMLSLPPKVGMALGSIVGATALVDALFLTPPVERDSA